MGDFKQVRDGTDGLEGYNGTNKEIYLSDIEVRLLFSFLEFLEGRRSL